MNTAVQFIRAHLRECCEEIMDYLSPGHILIDLVIAVLASGAISGFLRPAPVRHGCYPDR